MPEEPSERSEYTKQDVKNAKSVLAELERFYTSGENCRGLATVAIHLKSNIARLAKKISIPYAQADDVRDIENKVTQKIREILEDKDLNNLNRIKARIEKKCSRQKVQLQFQPVPST